MIFDIIGLFKRDTSFKSKIPLLFSIARPKSVFLIFLYIHEMFLVFLILDNSTDNDYRANLSGRLVSPGR